MYFFELIRNCNKELLIKEFLKMEKDIAKHQNAEANIRKALCSIERIIAYENDSIMLCIEKCIDNENAEMNFDDVYALDTSDSEKYALEINPWASTLGYLVDENSLLSYGIERFAALVLWEMTWFGYDDSKIQSDVKSWSEDKNYTAHDLLEFREFMKTC